MIKVKEHTKYLLKQELQCLKKKLQRESDYNNHLEELIKESSVKKSATITITGATKVEFVPVDNIIYCNADGGYTEVQLVDGRVISAAKTLTVFQKTLEQHSFFRISKSHLINTDHIITFHKDRNQILLYGNILLNISRRRRIEFLKTV